MQQNPSFRDGPSLWMNEPSTSCPYLRNTVLQAGRALSTGGGSGHGGGGLHYGGGHVCRRWRGGRRGLRRQDRGCVSNQTQVSCHLHIWIPLGGQF